MKRALLLLFAVVAMSARAGEQAPLSFEERVWIAQAAEEDESVHPYPSQVFRNAGRELASAMRRCWISPSSRDAKSFVLVADIDAEGHPRAVEVKPRHAAARCFAARFSAIRYMPPPEHPWRGGFPVMMRIAGGRAQHGSP